MSNAVPAQPHPYWDKGKDFWIRARTNALAHRIAAEELEQKAFWFGLVEALVIVVPIVAVSLSLYYVTAATEGKAVSLPLGVSFTQLSLTAIFANGVGLFLTLIGKQLKLNERASQHRTLLSNYSAIAQKIRRLDTKQIPEDEAKSLYQHMQEAFEMYKSSTFEPDNKTFLEAQKIMKDLKPLPFNIAL